MCECYQLVAKGALEKKRLRVPGKATCSTLLAVIRAFVMHRFAVCCTFSSVCVLAVPSETSSQRNVAALDV